MTAPGLPALDVGDRQLAREWRRLDGWLASELPALRESLNPPASEDAIAAAEARLGRSFPPALLELYRLADGERPTDPVGLFFGLPLLSLAEMIDQRATWDEVHREVASDDWEGTLTSQPVGAIRTVYGNPGWLPIAKDWGGNHLAVDLDPGPAGVAGQIINFGSDEDNMIVLAPGIGALIGWIADNLQAGNWRLDAGSDGVGPALVLADPPNDHFLDTLPELAERPRRHAPFSG